LLVGRGDGHKPKRGTNSIELVPRFGL